MTDMSILGLGSDLLRIERIARLGRSHGSLVLDRMLAPAERLELDGYGDRPADWPGCAPRIASIVAAKEAFFKALGTGLVQPLRWADVAVGRPALCTLTLRSAAQAAFAALGGAALRLAICGDSSFVLATVIILGHPITGHEARILTGDTHA
jgi:holo-[acyl-carrier protein] synthase